MIDKTDEKSKNFRDSLYKQCQMPQYILKTEWCDLIFKNPNATQESVQESNNAYLQTQDNLRNKAYQIDSQVKILMSEVYKNSNKPITSDVTGSKM